MDRVELFYLATHLLQPHFTTVTLPVPGGAGIIYPSAAPESTPGIDGSTLRNLWFSVIIVCPFSFGH